jgi:hypothetical protein
MQTIKFLCKINMIMLLMLSIWGTVPAWLCCAGQQSFTVQVMAGADKEAASRFAEELMHKGFDAFIDERTEKEKPVYKVYVGSFTDRKDGAQLYEALRKQGIDGWITRVPEPPAQKNDEEKITPVEQQQPLKTEAEKKAEPEAQAETAPADKEKPFVLIIHPVPAFTKEETQTAASSKRADTPVSQPAKTYKYFNPGDNIIHITTSIETVPPQYRKKIWEIALYPVYFKSAGLRDMIVKMDMEGAIKEVILEGLTQPGRVASAQAVRDFETLLESAPLRIKYYPQRTDPDGTLHGSLFLKDGTSVECEMVRRGLAACEDDNLPWFQHKACADTAGKTSGQTRPSAEPKE